MEESGKISFYKGKSANCYSSKNTVGLTIQQYIDKAGEAKLPQRGEIQYNDTGKWHKTLEAFLKKDGKTKALFLDFDGTMARFTDTAAQTLAVHGFLSSLKKLVEKGYKIAIVTGRAMEGEGGILPALKRSGADDQLLNQLEIFASHGSQQRGSDTHWEVKETQEIKDQVEKVKKDYDKLNNQLQSFIQWRINKNEKLRDLEITFDSKEPVGCTIHYRQVEESRHEEVKGELEKLLVEIMPEEKTQTDFSCMKDETYKPFTYRSATKSFEILLNEETTGMDLSKGAIVRIFAEKWGVKVGIAFGDDKTDLKMQKWLKALEDAGKLLQAFVGISHTNSPSEINDQSTIVLKEQENPGRLSAQEMAVGLLAHLAQRALEG
jgi:trehalose-6-phosphatase